MAAARCMTARTLATVAERGGPTGAPVHPVMARTWAWTKTWGEGFKRGQVPLTEQVKGKRHLLVEVDRNADGVDWVCRGHVSRSQCSAVVDLGGLSRGARPRRQPHILSRKDDIPCTRDLSFKAGNFHQLKGLGRPVRVLCGVAV